MKLFSKLKLKLKEKRGQNTAEYVLMLVLVAGAAIGTFTIFGGAVGKRFSDFIAAMNGQATAPDTKMADELDKNAAKWGMGEFNDIKDGGPQAGGSAGATTP